MKILTDTGLMVLWNKIKQLVLGNRPYNPSEFSGKGYKVLEKNIQTVGGVKKNILTAIMLSEANTIYEIRYDFDLDGETIEMQDGCTLKFCGGSLKNGTLKGANTVIKSDITLIFKNVDLLESFNALVSYPEWFGGIADNPNVDNTASINKCLTFFNMCYLSNGLYYVKCDSENNNIIKVPQGKILSSNKRHFGYGNIEKIVGIVLKPKSICNYMIEMTYGAEVSNIYIIAQRNVNGLRAKGSRMNIETVCVIGANIGINIEAYLTIIKHVNSALCNIGFKITGNYSGNTYLSKNTSLSLIDCYASECRDVGYAVSKLTYSNFINCACDHTGMKQFNKDTFKAAYYLENCDSINILGCGSEENVKLLYCENCRNLTVNVDYIVNYNAIIDKDSKYFTKYIDIHYCTLCDFKLQGDFINLPDSVPRKYVYIYDTYRDIINTINCKAGNITIEGSTDSEDLIESIANNTILKGNARELRNSLVLKNSDNYIPTLKSSDAGVLLFNKTLKKMILWNGSEWTNVDGTILS